MSSNHTYRAAIIGLGFIGAADDVSAEALGQVVAELDGTHFGALTKNPRIELVAGSSRDAGRRERFTKRLSAGSNARTYTSWREMLDQEKPEIVSIATYTPQHAEMTIACAEKGVRAIYCEKPMASTALEAQQMVDACQKAGALLAINHNMRYSPNYRRLRDLVADGELGELTSANLQWGTGRLGNVGTHMIDVTQMITGRQVEAVSGLLDLAGKPDCRGPEFSDPGGWGLLRLAGGLIATVDAADYGIMPGTVVINGTKGRAFTERHEITLHFRDGRRTVWTRPGKEITSMDRAVAEIVAWLDDGTPFSNPPENAARTLEAIIAFHISHDCKGSWVDLPLAGSDRERVVSAG